MKIFRLLFLFFFAFSFAQNDYNYTSYGTNNGLSSSQIYDIYQDKKGYIWLATQKGIIRYNGYEFEKFGSNEKLEDAVLDFFPQGNGQIWCRTLNTQKTFFIDEKSEEIKLYDYNDKLNSLISKKSVVESIYLDDEQSLHIGGKGINGEIIISEEGEVLKPPSDTELTEGTYIISKEYSSENPFFFLSNDTTKLNKHLIKTKLKGALRSVITLGNEPYTIFINGELVEVITDKGNIHTSIKNNYTPLGLKTINDSQFFVGYHHGGARIVDINGNTNATFLEGLSVTNFLIDHHGGYWFSTLNSGLFYIKNPCIKNKRIPFIENPHVNSLAKDENNTLYFSTTDGCIVRFKQDEKAVMFSKSAGNIHGLVTSDTIKNELFIYNNNRLITPFNKNIELGYTLKLSEPDGGSTILASSNGAVRIITPEYVNSIDTPYRVLDAIIRKDTLYIGTSKGLFKQNETSFTSFFPKGTPFFDARIEDIDIHPKNEELYLATVGKGIIVVKKGSTYTIDTKDGLNSNTVKEIYFENENVLWACTNKGVNRIVFGVDNDIDIKGVSVQEGLISNEIEDIEIIDDIVWLGTKKGITYFPKSVLESNKPGAYFLKIKSIKVNDSIQVTSRSQKLKYNENNLEFFVEGILFANNKLKYKYKLEGFDEEWQLSDNRKIRFSSLPHGSYTFMVKACDNENDCSENVQTYSFNIKLPYWKTLWFQLTCLIAILLLIYLFLRIKILYTNRSFTRELMRLLIKRVNKNEKYILFKEGKKEIKIKTSEILYVKSSGNYIDIITEYKNYTLRTKIGCFIESTPDPLEYIRIHRSYIIRLDKVHSKSKTEVTINNEKLPVSTKYVSELDKIHF
ncbi:hypothetical protein IWQ47_003823 [Aquimarina sp. EL_43]|uniref:triple tyrosine motif-containing protein n=1 Tax=unclassified Aquimarina TaxID=2627091 RepID=UPI0018CACC44|nr:MULTISPECIES: triple tyrosine motif-containing protein [unclassified Aquimarina]MBG6132598.1 hypothetical protein [Aquimarina sp. EL_35]MBG6152729.1 hypothetical protein [Aquimarina sp. EL_32]MBG6170736.1 hypothetical protein [Aquimarina sp. EL_43]